MQKLLSWLNSSYKYLIAAVFLVVILYPKFPTFKVPGTFVSIRTEDFLLLFAAFVAGIKVLGNLPSLFKNSLGRSILIFFLVGLVSVLSGILVTQTIVPTIGILHWLRRIEYIVPFFLALYAFRVGKKEDLEFYLKVAILAVLIVFIYGYGQKHFSWPVIVTQNEEYSKGIALTWIPGSHINSTFAGHYDLAAFLVLVLPTFVVLLFSLKGLISKGICLITLLSGFWLFSGAVSRISVVAFLFSSSLALLLVKKYKELVVFLAVSLIIFSFSGDLRARYIRIIEVAKEKIFSYQLINKAYAAEEVPVEKSGENIPTPTPVPVFEDRSTSIRLNVEWPRAVRAFFKNPLLGTGFSSITLATDNEYLRVLGEAGLLGLVAFGLVIVNLGLILSKSLSIFSKVNIIERAFLAGILGSLPGILLIAFFIDIFEASKFAIIFWLIMGLAVSLIRNYQNEQTV